MTVECYDPAQASHGLEGLPPQQRQNAAVCDVSVGTWHTPRFLLLGFPKCGSSELWALMHLHPQVVRLPNHKEEHTFDDLHSPIGRLPYEDSWRAEHFDDHPTQRFRSKLPTNLSDDEVCGDGTPWYAAHRNAHTIMLRVRQWAPAAAFIVVLRSPVRAWWSLQCMYQRNSRHNEHPRDAGASFDEDVFRLPLPVDGREDCSTRHKGTIASWEGMAMPRELLWAYAERLRVWRSGFARSRFLLLRSDELEGKVVNVSLARVWRFLGLRSLGADQLSWLLQPHLATQENVASGGDRSVEMRCQRHFSAGGRPPDGGEFSTPSEEALLDALRVYFGHLVGVANNPWPEAQVDALVADRWVDAAFIEPWVSDARALAEHAKSLRSVCPRTNSTTGITEGRVSIPEDSRRAASAAS